MRTGIVAVVIAIGAAIGAGAIAAQQSASSELSRQEGIRVMRAINTMEAQIRATGTGYGSLQEVITHAGFSAGPAGDPTREDSDSALIRNHRMTLLRSQDGTRYQVSIVPTSTAGLAFFSGQNGTIFVGEVLR